MGEYLLHKNFFKKNPLDKISAAIIADFSLTVQFNDELNAEMERIVGEGMPNERHIRVAKDKEDVENLDSGEAVVIYMRKGIEGCMTHPSIPFARTVQITPFHFLSLWMVTPLFP